MTQQRADYPLDYGTKERAKETADTAADQLKAVGDKAQEMAGKVTEQAREYAQKAQEAAQQFKPLVEKSLKDQPMATLAGAAVVGFVLGALWKK